MSRGRLSRRMLSNISPPHVRILVKTALDKEIFVELHIAHFNYPVHYFCRFVSNKSNSINCQNVSV